MYKDGFYTALGTPLDENGNLVEKSMARQIESQIAAGASGLLLAGTMGTQGCLTLTAYEHTLARSPSIVKGRVPVLVGAFDNSLALIKLRMGLLEKYGMDAAVLTAPYYLLAGEAALMRYFRQAAGLTGLPVFLYDHPSTTKHKLTYPMVVALSQEKNITGIKCADLIMMMALYDRGDMRADFALIFSGSDLFVPAYLYGMQRYMDGIFCCMPKSIEAVQKCFAVGDFDGARAGLGKMMTVRDGMIAIGLWPAFTFAMNRLGFEGNFGPDYEPDLDAADYKRVEALLSSLGEIA